MTNSSSNSKGISLIKSALAILAVCVATASGGATRQLLVVGNSGEYAPLVQAGLQRELSEPVELKEIALSDAEGCALAPDYLIVATGDEIPSRLKPIPEREAFRASVEKALDAFAARPTPPKTVIRGVFDPNSTKDGILHQVARDRNVTFVPCIYAVREGPQEVARQILDSGWTAKSRNPLLVGTAGDGHISPAATTPFGLVQAGPDTSAVCGRAYHANYAHTCGYQYQNLWLWRFSQTRLMGTGAPSLGDFGVLPFPEGFSPTNTPARMLKETEKVEPGYYAISFREADAVLAAEIAASPHGAIYRFQYPKGKRAKLLVDLDWGIGEHSATLRSWRYFVESTFASFAPDSTRMWGLRRVHNWTDYQLHFAARFSRPFVSKRRLQPTQSGRGEIWELDFGELDDDLFFSIALSYISPTAAERNLAAEIPTCDARGFDAVREAGAADWRKALSVIELDPKTDEETKINFKAALYRTFLQPNLISDVGKPARYSTFSLWDTFRAAHPLYTITAPERVPDFVNSLLDCYDRQGYLPLWGLAGLDSHCMIGHHAVSVIVDWYLKEQGNSTVRLPTSTSTIDWERAYRAVKESLTKNHVASSIGGGGHLKEDFDLLDRYGYYPYDRLTPDLQGDPIIGESVSRLIEGAFDDACAARLAAGLGHADDAAFFARRAQCWTNVYDRTTGFVRGRNAAGAWREPFSPFALGTGGDVDNDFTEGNAWQYTWGVLHDFNGLFAQMGGKAGALKRLDEFFAARPPSPEDGDTAGMTGAIGQYCHGNEPSHHVAYLYALLGRPEKTDEIVERILKTQYFARPDGLCGNDDCGQMAAWYVFSTLGFYPVNPCGGEYVLGKMPVPSATIRFPDGRTRTLRPDTFGPDRTVIRHSEL